jgi:putative transposase
MKKSRFSEQQIAFVLRQAEEGTAVAEVYRKAGISGPPSIIGARSMAV